MKILGILLIFLSFSFELQAETTSTRQQRRNNFHRNRGAAAAARSAAADAAHAACTASENKFKGFVLDNMNSALDTFDTASKCLGGAPVPPSKGNCTELNNLNMENYQAYRAGLAQVYKALQEDYIKNHPVPEAARACFGNDDRNIRGPIMDSNFDHASCMGIMNGYYGGLDFNAEKVLKGEIASNLSSDELQFVKSYQQSPVGRSLRDNPNSVFMNTLSEEEQKRALNGAFNSLTHRVKGFRDKVDGFADHELYKLYDFQDQFQRYTSMLPEAEARNSKACKDSSGYAASCTNSRSLSRCGSKLWGLAKDFIPFLPVIDGFAGLGDIRAARDAGIMTQDEATSASVENLLMAATGLGGIAGGVIKGLVRGGTRVASRATTRAATTSLTSGQQAAARRLGMNDDQYRNYLARNMSPGLTDSARLGLVNENGILKAGISASTRRKQQQAILRAHNACRGTSQECLLMKRRILAQAGLDRGQIRELMDRGITGLAGEVTERAGMTADNATDLLRRAGISDDRIKGILDMPHWQQNQGVLSRAYSEKVYNALSGAGRDAMRRGDLAGAQRYFDDAGSVLQASLGQAIEEGNKDAMHAYTTRLFAQRGMREVATDSGARVLPKSDDLFDEVLTRTSYFDDRLAKNSLEDVYNPVTNANQNRFDGRLVGMGKVEADQLILNNNRQIQEIRGIISYLNRQSYERPDMPAWLERELAGSSREAVMRRLNEYANIYTRNVRMISGSNP